MPTFKTQVAKLLTRSNNPEQFEKMARDLFSRGRYEEAVLCYERANNHHGAQRAKVCCKTR
jgi:Tfp pilus assembly protein PilF